MESALSLFSIGDQFNAAILKVVTLLKLSLS